MLKIVNQFKIVKLRGNCLLEILQEKGTILKCSALTNLIAAGGCARLVSIYYKE